MRVLITQFCNGVMHGDTYRSSACSLDNGNSEIFASSLFMNLNQAGEDVSQPKDTDDKIVIGYTKDGMAFQIVVDGFFGGDRHAIFTFIDTSVVPLMEQYSCDLSLKEDSRSVSESIIRTIYALRKEKAVEAEFTMSIAMTYQKDNRLYCSGFGIGDTSIVINRADGTIEQLVVHTEIDGFKDAFDSYSQTNIDLVIRRNSLFDTEVKPGDELVAYTYILPELEKAAQEFTTESIASSTKEPVRHLVLDLQPFNNRSSLFLQLLDVVKEKQEKLLLDAQKSGQPQRWGDDFTVGRLVIPDRMLTNQLKFNNTIVALNIGLAFYIAHETEHKSYFSFFLGTKQTIQRATGYKNLMATYQHNSLISLVIMLAMLSSNEEKPMNDYLIAHLGLPSITAFKNTIEALLTEEIKDNDLDVTAQSIDEIVDKIISYINNPAKVNIDLLFTDFAGLQQVLGLS